MSVLRSALSRCLLVLAAAGILVLPANGATIQLATPHLDKPAIPFGVSELARALESAGYQIAPVTPGALAPDVPSIQIYLAGDDRSAELLSYSGMALPEKPESYVTIVQKEGPAPIVYIVGRDTTGAMYGAMDIAEQIGWMRSAPDLGSLQPRVASPATVLRGTNPFLHIQALQDPASWYYDDAFWTGYLDQLARTRHNLLDIHACYDLTSTLFPNVYPYLFKFDTWPAVGVNAAQAKRNLDQLKKIVAEAKKRGIRVGLMSYHASYGIPGNELPDPTDAELADYTAQCVKALITEVPDLAFVGFRIGESGKEAKFYQDSYIRGLQMAGRTDVSLYARSWLTTQKAVEAVAESYPGKMYLEIKYNGEHLGMPYPVTGGWMRDKGSYSYQSYSNFPRKTTILWQIRANGTHRVFPWGDPDFVRRATGACTLIDGAGYTVEPMTAYYPWTDYNTNSIYYSNNLYRYLYERDWFWYELWGRLGYDPATPERVWIEMFRERFGAAAGEAVYRMFVESSRIVPLVYSYRAVGPDHRNIAPEQEWAGSVEDFLKSTPMEVNNYLSIREYADLLLSGKLSGRITPVEVCRELTTHARQAEELATQARALGVSSPREFEYLARNTQALKALADYYVHKIQAALEMDLARRTGSPASAAQMKAEVEAAIASWDALVAITEKAFHPFLEALRGKGEQFHWKTERQNLDKDKEIAEQFVKEINSQSEKAGPAIYALPVRENIPGATISFQVNYANAAPASIIAVARYRIAGATAFNTVPLDQHIREGILAGNLPPQDIPAPGGLLEYYIEASIDNAKMVLPASAPVELYRQACGADRVPPVIESQPAKVDREKGTIVITARITDPRGIRQASVRYKAMPSTAEWQQADLLAQEDVYSATLPMTYEGLQYSIEAIDQDGNGIVWPDVHKDTPYITVEGWDRPAPQKQSYSQDGITAVCLYKLAFGKTALGQPVYHDRGYTMDGMPGELAGLTRLLFNNDDAKSGDMEIEFEFTQPTRLFVAFGKPGHSGWSHPVEGWTVYKADAYQQENRTFDIHVKDFPAGKSMFKFEGGTGAILGFKPVE